MYTYCIPTIYESVLISNTFYVDSDNSHARYLVDFPDVRDQPFALSLDNPVRSEMLSRDTFPLGYPLFGGQTATCVTR
jgi:hypothetical protein